MLFGIVSNRRILAHGNDARASTTFEHRSRDAFGRRSRLQGVAKSFFGSGFERFPFFSRREGNRMGRRGRKNAVLEVQRRLALGIKRMHGDETQIPLVVNEHCRDRMIDGPRWMNSRRESPNGNARAGIVAVNDGRRVKPAAAAGIKQPAPVMVGSPAPRLVARKCPAESWIPNPLTIIKRRPAIPSAKGPPAKTVTPATK